MVKWNNWIFKRGVEILRACGLQPGDEVIEFGSGEGDYTLPAAVLIGEGGADGKITAIDKDGYDLRQLLKRAEKRGLTNIETLETGGTISIEKQKDSIDVVLVFDVLHYFTTSERSTLYREINRILKANGLFITFPQHYKESYPLWKLADMSLKEIINEIEAQGFSLQNKWEGKLIHDHSWYDGIILTFKKKIA